MTPFDAYISHVNRGETELACAVDLTEFSDRELDRVYEAEVNDWADTEFEVPNVSVPYWCADIGRNQVMTAIQIKRRDS